MNCVISIAAWLPPTRCCLLPLGLAAALSTLGCSRAQDAQAVKSARDTPHVAAPAETGRSDPAVAQDDEDAWVPMTGSETVIVDKLELLTDDAAVQVAPADEATATAPNVSPER